MKSASVLLVHPGSLRGGDGARGPRVKPELVSVRAALARGGLTVEVLDFDVEERTVSAADEEAFLAAADDLLMGVGARVVAISCGSALHFGAALAVAQVARRRRPGAVIVAFGQHATVRPDDFVDAEAPIDWVIQGDAEVSLVAIARDVAETEHEPGVLRVGQGEPLALSAATTPDYAGYPYTRSGLPGLGVYLSRGCQYRDAICYGGPGGGRWHAYPPEVAVRILDEVGALTPDEIEVLDPTFGFDAQWRDRVLGVLSAIDRRAVPLSLSARPDAFARKDIDAVYGGRLHLHLNVGTLSPALLGAAELPRPGRRVEGALELIRYANAKGVPVELDLVFGQPGETRATAAETLAHLEALIASFPNTSVRPVASRWAYFPGGGGDQVDVEAPARRYGTRIVHPEWWKTGLDPVEAAYAVVPSDDLADLAPGDDSYWRPRFDEVREAYGAKLTAEARHGLRSHESVGSAAVDVPHGFYREPRWH